MNGYRAADEKQTSGSRLGNDWPAVVRYRHETNSPQAPLCRFPRQHLRPSLSDNGRHERRPGGPARDGGTDPAPRGQPALHHPRYPSRCLGPEAGEIHHGGGGAGGEEERAGAGSVCLHGARVRTDPAARLRLRQEKSPSPPLVVHRRRLGRGTGTVRGGGVAGGYQRELAAAQLRRPAARSAGTEDGCRISR